LVESNKIRCDMEWIHLLLGRSQWRALVNTAVGRQFPYDTASISGESNSF